jgi:GntR family transcriptional regulator/MocR family aminotransferase
VYGRLAAEGFVEGRAGGGTFVSRVGVPNDGAARPRAKPTALRPVPALVHDAWLDDEPTRRGARFDLRAGLPDRTLFPLVEWRRCAATAHERPPGYYGDPAGIEGLRRVIARWIGKSRAVEASHEQVIVTAGAQQAIDLVTRLLVQPGEIVAMEDPGYPPVRQLVRALGATVAPVPVDAEGIVVEQIPPEVRMVYTTPSHQSPLGATMSLPRRRALLDFAERHDVAIVEDDYDSEYRHVDRPLEPLQRLDRSGRVIYVGTFSKVLSPALRLGFLILPEPLVEAAANLRKLVGGKPADAMQLTLMRFIVDGHLDRHLRRTRRIYSERHGIVTRFVDEAAAAGLLQPAARPNAGLHVSVLLPPGVDEDEVRASGHAAGVALGAFAECWVRPDPPAGIVLGFGAIATEELPEALDTLAGVLRGTRGAEA